MAVRTPSTFPSAGTTSALAHGPSGAGTLGAGVEVVLGVGVVVFVGVVGVRRAVRVRQRRVRPLAVRTVRQMHERPLRLATREARREHREVAVRAAAVVAEIVTARAWEWGDEAAAEAADAGPFTLAHRQVTSRTRRIIRAGRSPKG